MSKIKEQLDYGDRPERMDPNLERKLSNPEGLYAKNPAMGKGAQDVQRLVSSRFGKVADKLKEVTGIDDISSKQVQGMIYQEMMRKLPNIMRIESAHKEELEQLAKEACLEETEIPEDWFEIEARLNRQAIDTSDFRFQKEKPEEKEKPKTTEIPSFDVDDLTDEEILELEKHKRNIINAIIQGAAKKGHYIFQKPEVKERLDEIDPSLYRDYLGIMAINDFLYFSMEQMIEMMSQTGQGVAGKVKLESNDDEDDEDGDGEGTPDTKIIADGMIFPILCHEIIKGLEEAKGRYGLPQDPELAMKVMGQTDILSNEPMQLRIGPEIVERIRFALPSEIYDDINKGLINWFHTVLYQIPAEEFLELIGFAISDDESKKRKATSKFKEIMREADQLKSDYDEYKRSNDEEEVNDFLGSLGVDDSDDDDDKLDDFLSGLGISRPK
jgi:hypothetical protein